MHIQSRPSITPQPPARPSRTEAPPAEEFHYGDDGVKIVGAAIGGAVEGVIGGLIGRYSPHFSTVALTTLGDGVLSGVGGLVTDRDIPARGGTVFGIKGLVMGALSSTLGATCGGGGVIAAGFIGAGVGAVLQAAKN